ncbi:DNA-directed RNA polymerase subunit delta [Brevibacillus fluminis]|uniref:DNA-directed RNA polymerase subunit delta n=1 Tax=Brevibacillus fluminis TaxID=511487 RepID=UPI003F8CDC1E
MSQLLKHIEAERLSEMAMVDIAYEILRETNRPFNFREIMDEISAMRGLTTEQTMSIIAQVYTEVNIDGRFICIGDNTWGLKRWYPTETIEETQEGGGKKKKVVLDDDFDDYDIEDEVEAEFEEEDTTFDETEDDFLDDEFEEEVDEDDEEIIDDEEAFEDEEEAEEDELDESDEDEEEDR